MLDYIINRGKEASTWRGLVLFVAAAFGLEISSELQDQIINLALGTAGLMAILFKDRLAK